MDFIFDNLMKADYQYCPTKFKLRHVMNRKPKRVSNALSFGICIHSGLSVLLTTNNLLEAIKTFTDCYFPFEGQDNIRTLLKGEELITAWEEQLAGSGYIPKEQEIYFTVELGPFIYCGIIDSIGEFDTKAAVLDFKTSKFPRDFVTYPNDQMVGYSWAASGLTGKPHQDALVDMLGIYKSSSDGYYKSSKISEPQSILYRYHQKLNETIFNEWTTNTLWWGKRMVKDIESGNFGMNTNNCTGKYGPCDFFPYCSSPSGAREFILQTEYIEEKWEPGKRD